MDLINIAPRKDKFPALSGAKPARPIENLRIIFTGTQPKVEEMFTEAAKKFQKEQES